MIFVSMGFAGLFFIVGLLGEYISRILIETQNRPFYSTKTVELYKPSRSQLQNAQHNNDIPKNGKTEGPEALTTYEVAHTR
ncbi:hypothetical protein [Paenibacillus pini]|uniref:Uncharacterized protein n=1 Tax=Paenibacillus pini JCM 16418 TaxID=1236976 RepID=W7YC00_9BACL|nr:hypothetical protein [Paenibacillus pini]GAF08390.1 hypothetical protein JCM16418_2464 [Paenibacillus pini JCM 16418]